MSLRAVQTIDGRAVISIGSDVRRRIAERRAAQRVDQQIAAALEGELSLGDLRLALSYAEQRAGLR